MQINSIDVPIGIPLVKMLVKFRLPIIHSWGNFTYFVFACRLHWSFLNSASGFSNNVLGALEYDVLPVEDYCYGNNFDVAQLAKT